MYQEMIEGKAIIVTESYGIGLDVEQIQKKLKQDVIAE